MVDLDYQTSSVDPQRYCLAAILSCVVPVACIFIILLTAPSPPRGHVSPVVFWVLYLAAIVSATGFGVTGLIQIKRARGNLRGTVLAIGGVIIGGVILLAPLAARAMLHH
jgi:hypothetical protein